MSDLTDSVLRDFKKSASDEWEEKAQEAVDNFEPIDSNNGNTESPESYDGYIESGLGPYEYYGH